MDFALQETSVDGLVTMIGETVNIALEIKTAIETECGRCLEPITIPVDTKFSYNMIPAPEKFPEPEIEVSVDEVNVGYYKGDEIDLDPVILEQIVIQIPIKPLCKEVLQWPVSPLRY